MQIEHIFYSGWQGLLRTVVVGVLAYTALVLLVRAFGKRTLSRMNAFDLIVTVALGSTLATIMLSKDTALSEGILAFALLIVLQFIITWLSVRSPAVSRLVKAEPRLLYHRGHFLSGAMHSERVNQGEILQAVRSAGFGNLEKVDAVVLETDGSFSVLPGTGDGAETALSNVSGFEQG